MSNIIDQRVVEMRFDNSHFEKNVSTTMSTLEKLKQKLNLSSASKGLDAINTSAKNVNMNGLGSAVETVTAKFSALQVMGVTALANITNSAVNAGKNIVKSLTIDPIKSGFSEYETKMGSVQTILANTEHQGTTLNDVTRALDELNLYADKTIYNFQEMTRNIGTFTAAGVDLNTSVRSIQGIANLAAVSGSTSQQASTAMYQLSQALSTGTVKLMDWNSVVNAGMGGKVFQNALIRTAAMLDGSAKDVEAWQKKNIDAYGSFRDSLTKGEWITSEVLTRTLEQFTMAAEEGSKEWEEFKKSLTESGYTETQAEEILKMANTATDAATKVKTFTQLLDTLKESAQSGWAQTWELIIGDFEEAKSFFTELSDMFGGIIGQSADRRNSLLGDTLGSSYDKLIGKINDAGIETEKFEENLRKVVGDKKLDPLIDEFGSLENVIKKGKISSDDLKSALGKIEEVSKSAFDFSDMAKRVEGNNFLFRRGGYNQSIKEVKKLQEALNSLGYELEADGKFANKTYEAVRAFQKAAGIKVDGLVGEETIAALEKATSQTKELAEGTDVAIDSFDELMKTMTRPSGRELLLESVMNIIKAIHRPLAAVGEAFRNTFSVTSDELYSGLEKLEKFTSKFVMGGILDITKWDELTGVLDTLGISTGEFTKKLQDVLADHGIDVAGLREEYGSLSKAFNKGAISIDHIKEALLGFDGITESMLLGGETADKVRRSFEGLFAIFKIMGTIVSGPLKLAFNVISKVLSSFGLSILDVTAGIGDTLVKFSDKVDKSIDAVSSVIAGSIGKWITEFKETQFFKTCAEWIESASQTISEAIDSISNAIENLNVDTVVERMQIFSDFVSKIGNKVANSEIFIAFVDGICGAFSKLKSYLPNFKLPKFDITNLTNFSKLIANFEGLNITGFTGTMTELGNYFLGIGSFKWETFKNKALEKFVTFWVKTGDKAKQAFEVCKEVALAIKKFIFGTEEVSLPAILDVAEKFLGIIVLIKALSTLNALISPFDNVTEALNNFAGSMKWNAITAGLKAMALALGVFTVCLVIISNMETKKAWSAAGMLIALMVVMGAVVSAIAFFASKIDGGINVAATAASLLMIVGAILLMVNTIKMIDDIDLKDPLGTFGILFTTLLALTAGVRMIAKAGGSSFKSVAAILTLMAALKLMLEVIEDYDKFDWSGKSGAIKKMVTMLVVLSAAINIASRGVKAGASGQGLALLLVAMVISLKILLNVIEDFAAMDTNTLVKGGLAVTALLGVMTLMAMALSSANKGSVLEKGQRSVNNFTGLAVALLAVVAAIWVLGKMDFETLRQGGLAVGQILLLFTGMLFAVGKSCSGLKIGSVITMLIAIGILMAEMAIIVHIMKDIPWESSLSSAGALIGMMLSIAAVLRVLTKHDVKASSIFKWVGAMAAMGLVLAELAAVLHIIKDINPVNAIGNVIALDILLAGMAVCLTTLTKHRNGAKSIYKWVGAMAAFALVMAELAIVLNLVKDINPTNAIGNMIAIDILLAGMAACLTTLTKHRNGAKSIYKWIGVMATLGLVMAELAIVLNLVKDIDPINAIGNVVALSALLLAMTASLTILSKCKVKANMGAIGALAVLGLVAAELVGVIHLMKGIDPASAIPNVIALSILVTVLSLVLIPLAAVGTLGTAGLLGVGTLATLATSLFILVGVLATMSLVSNATANAKTLAGLVTVLTLVLIPLTVIGAFGVAGLIGVGVLATMMASLFIVVGILAAMQGIKNAQSNADIIIELLTTMTDALVKISLLAPLAVIGVGALSALVGLVTRLGILVAAVGMLTEYVPDIEKFVDKGLEVFKKLAGGLGEMISAFGVGLTSGLPDIGENLSAFVEAAKPFIDLVGNIDDDVSTGTGNLVSALVKLLAADFISGIASANGTTLSDLGTDLSGFAKNMDGFITAMSGVKPEVITGVGTLCDAINALTSANLKDAWTQILPGDNSLSSFGTNIAAFADCIKNAASSLKGITDSDVENIKRSAAAGEALAELNSAIPAQGGWAQTIMGSKELGTFGSSIEAFADCLVSYSEKVSGKNIDADAIRNSADAALAISDLNNAIPAQGGWAQTIMGSKELSTFGSSLDAFADCIVSYSNKVSGQNLDAAAITNSATAAEALATLNGKLPSQNGMLQAVTGEKNLGDFGTKLVSFATGIVAYANAAVQIDESKITAITNSGKAIDELVLVMDKIPETGGWGDAIFGASDGQSFGASLSSVAKGITAYCTAAATINSGSITAIQNSGKAIDELSLIMEDLPETDNAAKATSLVSAANSLVIIGSAINNLSVAGYDYSGLSTFKTQITKLTSITSDVAVEDISSDFSLFRTAVGAAVTCAQRLSSMSGYNYDGISQFKTALKTLSTADVDSVINAFAGKSSQMAAAVSSFIASITNGLSGAGGKVSGAMTSLVTSAVNAARGKTSEFESAGKTLGSKLINGIKANASSANSAGSSLGSNAASGARSQYSGAYSAGSYLGAGFVAGCKTQLGSAYQAGYTLGEFALQGIRDALATASPSKEGIKLGKFLGAGLVIGMNDTGSSVYNAGESMGNDALAGMSNSISRVSSVIESGIDTQPTIRPVLDLSDVRSGASSISSLLGSDSTVGVMSNVGAISSMMNRYGQNGAENEIVTAINRLRKDLGNVGSTTYTIGDITYDDGSNVSDAVRTLVRETRIGRRR